MAFSIYRFERNDQVEVLEILVIISSTDPDWYENENRQAKEIAWCFWKSFKYSL